MNNKTSQAVESHKTYFMEDPTGNSPGFYSDLFDRCYYDKEGKKKMYCPFHKRTQVEHNGGWFVCNKCEKELL